MTSARDLLASQLADLKTHVDEACVLLAAGDMRGVKLAVDGIEATAAYVEMYASEACDHIGSASSHVTGYPNYCDACGSELLKTGCT
jgi:hypothetical protein